MKIHEYNEMMSYLTRPAMAYGGRIGFKRGTQPLPKNVRLTPEGQYRFSTQVGEGFSKSFPKGTKLSEVEKFRDTYLQKFGIEEGQLRKKTTEGPFKNVKGEKHIKFNGKTYQVSIQRGGLKPTYVDSLSEAKILRDDLVIDNPPKWIKGVTNRDEYKDYLATVKRRKQQKVQEGRLIRYNAPKGYQVHHIMPLAGYRDMTNQDIAVVSSKMNQEMAQFDKPINKLVNEAENLDFNKTKSLSRLQEINEELAEIVKKAEKKLGPKYKGLLGFNKLTPVLDTLDDKGRQVFRAEPVGIDYSKTVGSKFKEATKIKDIPTKEILKQVSDAPKFKANMIPGLETLINTVKSIPDDVKGKRYWRAGLKGLGVAVTPLIVYDGYTAIKEGLPADEVVARALLGADRVIYKGKEYLTMSPEARAAKGRKTTQTMAEAAKEDPRVKGYAEMYGVEGKFKPDFIKEGDEELIEAAEKKYADYREKKDAARVSERAKVAKAIKDKIYGVSLEEITNQQYNQGGRVGYAKGPKDPKRRAVLKGIGALALLPIVGKYFKSGKLLVGKASTYTGPVIEKIKGMPEWLPSLVKRLWNEGEDVTKTAATMERQVVKRGTLESGDDVDLIYDVGTGDVRIDVTPTMNPKTGYHGHETKSGAFNKEYGLELTKGEEIATKKGSIKTKDEFKVVETEPVRTGHPEDPDWDWDGTSWDNVDDAITDLTELEAFATKKTTKQIHKKKGTKKKDVFPEVEFDDSYDLDYDID